MFAEDEDDVKKYGKLSFGPLQEKGGGGGGGWLAQGPDIKTVTGKLRTEGKSHGANL